MNGDKTVIWVNDLGVNSKRVSFFGVDVWRGRGNDPGVGDMIPNYQPPYKTIYCITESSYFSMVLGYQKMVLLSDTSTGHPDISSQLNIQFSIRTGELAEFSARGPILKEMRVKMVAGVPLLSWHLILHVCCFFQLIVLETSLVDLFV